MAREKIKFALRIAPETQRLVKELCERDNCQSQNEFIEKAIRFYAGYVSGNPAFIQMTKFRTNIVQLFFPKVVNLAPRLHCLYMNTCCSHKLTFL